MTKSNLQQEGLNIGIFDGDNLPQIVPIILEIK